MPLIAGVREAEAWSAANVVGAIVLLVAFVLLMAWLVRRYLQR